MGKYSKFDTFRDAPPRKWKVHPIWRGIGCFMLIILPIMSYYGALSFLEANQTQHWIRIPKEMMVTVNAALAQKIPPLSDFLGSMPRLLVSELVVTLLFLVIGFGILTIMGSFLYSAAGPSRYGPLDSPPVGRSPHRGVH